MVKVMSRSDLFGPVETVSLDEWRGRKEEPAPLLCPFSKQHSKRFLSVDKRRSGVGGKLNLLISRGRWVFFGGFQRVKKEDGGFGVIRSPVR